MTGNGTPSDEEFEAYWRGVDTELDRFESRPVLHRTPGRCTDDFTGYEVRLTSLGPYRIFGYLSVPTGEGPFPALMATPGYLSVNNPPHYIDRLRYVTLTIMHRGQRLADSPFAASYPGLLTMGIEHQDSYIYREIVADCLRAAEFLVALPEVDASRMAIVGDDLAVLTAARRPVFRAVQLTELSLYRAAESLGGDPGYPLEEINDYLREHEGAFDTIVRTLAYFDASRHAAGLSARIWAETPEPEQTPSRETQLADTLGDVVERYPPTFEVQADTRAADRWLAGLLGVPAMSRFERSGV